MIFAIAQVTNCLGTITVCQLENGEYKTILYKGDDVVKLKSFPELKLTANQIFQSAEVDN